MREGSEEDGQRLIPSSFYLFVYLYTMHFELDLSSILQFDKEYFLTNYTLCDNNDESHNKNITEYELQFIILKIEDRIFCIFHEILLFIAK